jgi:hypothetical protein
MNSTLPLLPAYVCGVLACAQAADVPDVPDLDALQREYDDPSGGLEPEEVEELVERFPELESMAAALRTVEPILARIDDARDTADGRSGSGVELRGALMVELACPGGARTPRYDKALNGSLSLELAVAGSEIQPTFWATAQGCLLLGAVGPLAFPVEIDGRIAIDVGSPIPLGGTWQRSRTLISHQGTISFGGLTLRDLSARLSQDRFEYLFDTPSGTVVLLVTEDIVGVRDRNATWFCDRGTAECAAR